MERVKSRSESPFSQNKSKIDSSSASENGHKTSEQVRSKKKNLRSKNKHQSNSKEKEDIGSNGHENFEKEQTANEADNKVDLNDVENGNEINGVNNNEDGNRHKAGNETNGNEDTAAIITYETTGEVIVAQDENEPNEVGTEDETESIKEEINVDENSSEESSNQTKIETENSAKNDIVLPDCKVVIEAFDERYNQGTNSVKTETNGLTQEQEPTCTSDKEVSQVGVNGSDDSLCYEAEEVGQASPDTATKNDYSLPSKITNFFGKLTGSTEQKQDFEISSSNKTETTHLIHPYLSRVSGRRGIKDRLNSSATDFSLTDKAAKTPENTGTSLDDSFRVRTNPPRLYSTDLEENPTLRKFKGKRCLNASDEPEEGEDAYLGTMKRRKLDEKANDTGILGSIMWSPFKKKSLDNENQLKLTTTESKLSRLLSPFWFWKKSTEGQNRK